MNNLYIEGGNNIDCLILKNKKCEITNYYSNNHSGIDLVGENYTIDSIICHSDGVIIEIQDGLTNKKGSTGIISYGNYLKIDHQNGYKTLYAHMGKGIPFKKGDKVKKGQVIGIMSDSGNAYGKHLHFEVYKNNKRVNPQEYINKDFSNNDVSILKYSIGDKVKIDGVYISSTSNEKLKPAVTEGTITKIIENARNPYLLNDGKIGWVNNESIIKKINNVNQVKYLSNPNYIGFSIVDALNEINVDSSYLNRSKLASINDIQNYIGSSSQNEKMLSLLKQGKLKSV